VTTSVTDGGADEVSAFALRGSCVLKYATADANGFVIFGDVPAVNVAFGDSRRIAERAGNDAAEAIRVRELLGPERTARDRGIDG